MHAHAYVIHTLNRSLNFLTLSLPPSLRRAIQLVRFEKCAEGSSYGIPTENEIRLLLIESKGDIVKAKKCCVKNRKEKVSVHNMYMYTFDALSPSSRLSNSLRRLINDSKCRGMMLFVLCQRLISMLTMLIMPSSATDLRNSMST